MRTLACLFLVVALGCCGTQGQVISRPDDVAICEGRGAVFTCILNSNIGSDDVQWYRFIKDTSTTEMVDPNGENINFLTRTIESTTNSSLTITNAMKSYTGYFWVGTPSLNVCNSSLTVLTSPPALTVNIMKKIENSSIVVQWDVVDDSLPTTYTIIWTDEGDLFEVETLTEQTSYTITGLTLDTVYTISVTPANRVCGNGPEFSTSILFSNDTTSTTSTISPTVTASTNPMTTVSGTTPGSTTTTTTTIIGTSTAITTTGDSSSTTIITIPSNTTFTTTTTTTTIISTSTAITTTPSNTAITTTTSTVMIPPSTTTPDTMTTTTVSIDADTAAKTTNLKTTIISTSLIYTTTTATTATSTASTSITTLVGTTATTTVVESSATTTITTSMESPGTTTTTASVPTTSAIVSTTSTGNPADTTKTDESSNGDVYIIIVGVIIAGIILVSLLFILFCFLGRTKGQFFNRKEYNNLKGNGTLNKDLPMVINPLDENDEHEKADKLEEIDVSTSLNSQPLHPPGTYDRLEPTQSLHPPGTYDRLGSVQQPLHKYDGYDKLPLTKKDSHDDDGMPSGIPTVTIPNVDVNQKTDDPSVDDPRKDTDDDQARSDVPTVTVPSSDDHTGDSAKQNSNDPALHYAVLQILPTPTGAYITKDDSFTPYALVTQI